MNKRRTSDLLEETNKKRLSSQIERQRDRDRERERETDRQTDRQRATDRQNETDRQRTYRQLTRTLKSETTLSQNIWHWYTMHTM